MPSWAALRKASKRSRMKIATRALRLPCTARGLSCVSRTFTSANSEATKNPFTNTSSSKARTRNVIERKLAESILQAHLAKNDPQNVLKAEDANLPTIAREHDGQALSTALHAAQGDFQPKIFLQIKRRL